MWTEKRVKFGLNMRSLKKPVLIAMSNLGLYRN